MVAAEKPEERAGVELVEPAEIQAQKTESTSNYRCCRKHLYIEVVASTERMMTELNISFNFYKNQYFT